MKSHTSTIALIAIAAQWTGCTSPKTNTSENLPSQIPANPLELHTTSTPETGELAGEPGVEGLPGEPVSEGIITEGDIYILPDIDFVNLKDTPKEERSLDEPRVRNPEDWEPESIQTPPGASGEAGEPEKIVILEHEGPEGIEAELAHLGPIDEETGPEDQPESDNPFEVAQNSLNLPARGTFPGNGEASAIPVFFPNDPEQLQLTDLVKWLDHHQIEHPGNFADSGVALQWLQQLHANDPDSLGDRKSEVDKLFAWLTSTPSGQDDPTLNRLNFLAGSPWNFPNNGQDTSSTKPNPLLMSKASLWLHNPALHPNTDTGEAGDASGTFTLPQSLQSSTRPATNAQASHQSLDYAATLHWIQLASQNKTPGQPSLSPRIQTSNSSRDHSEVLRWIQKASGKRKAPLHASVLSPSVPNP